MSSNVASNGSEDIPEKVELRGYVDARLYAIVLQDAESRTPPIPLSEAVAQAVAKAYARPDLAAVPRKPIGRKRGMKLKKRRKAAP